MRSTTVLCCLLAAAMLVGAACPAAGQSYEWRPGDGLPGTNAVVNAMATWDPDGAGPKPELLVMGGSFTIAGQVMASQIVAWDGSNWQLLDGGVSGTVYALAVYNGDLIAGGAFTAAGGTSAYNVARWNGTSWQPLGLAMMNGNGYVQSLAVYNGDLYAGGTFNMAGMVYTKYISRWDGSTWQPVGGGMSNGSNPVSVSSLTVYGGELIAAGYFNLAGTTACNNIARWNGSAWQPLDGGVTGGSVSTLELYNGLLVAGGGFTTAGGIATKGLARWDGTTWQSLGGGITNGAGVSCLAVYNGQLIVGGNFYALGNTATKYVASWDGSHWQQVGGWTTGTSFYVDALGVYDGQLFAGGNFTNIGSLQCNYVGRWDGTTWRTLTTGMNNTVNALAVHDGQLVAGGTFTTAAGDEACTYIGRTSGSGWQPMGSGMNNAVNALTVYNGDLIAGGTFTTAGGVACNRIARWNGSVWQPLGVGVNSTVTCLTVWNGLLIAGGSFTSAGGVACSRIAAWNGTSWQPLDGGTNNTVYALTVYNGQLVAGGYFSTAGTTTVNRIARWDGSTWQALGSGMNGSVLALVEFDGQLIAGGEFNAAGGVPYCWSVARWNGSSWATMDETNGSVSAFTIYNSELYCAGYFGAAGHVAARTVARWDGTAWVPMSGGLNGSASYALTVYNGELVVGGNFQATYDGKVSSYWARWGPVMPTFLTQPIAQSVLLGEPASFTVSAIGAGTLSYQWFKDGELVQGAGAATLSIAAVAADDDGIYTCVATNTAGSTTSEAVHLTVLIPAAIDTQPTDQSVQAGGSVTFSVAAHGTPTLQYQWRKAGVALADNERISGATTDTLAISNVQLADVDTYDVVVTNAYGTATSNAVSLAVLPTILAQPVGATVIAGNPITLSVSAIGSGNLSYQWRKDGAALTDDGRIAGSLTNVLTVSPSQAGDAGGYDVVITSEYGTITSDAATVSVMLPPAIVAQPVSQSVLVGEPVTLTVTASGSGTLSYQWYKDGAALTDDGRVVGSLSNVLTINPSQTADAATYDVVVTSEYGAIASNAVTVTINVPPAIVTQPAGQSVVAGAPITLSVAASGSGTLSYQWRKDGAALADDSRIAGSTTATLTINPSATTDAGSYDVVVTSEYGTITSDAAVVEVRVPITITRQPTCPPVKIGDPAVILAEATGAGELSYQWRKDGVALADSDTISGTTTNALAIDPVSLADAGTYDVVISAAGSSVTSSAAALAIINAQATPVGSQVSLPLVDPNTGYACATVTFQNVTSPGLTAVTTVAPSDTQGPPSGFKFGAPPTLYQLDTTAVFSGPIEVCFDYGNISFLKELRLKLFHFDNGSWVNVTSSLDIFANRICGQVEHFSLFGVFEEEETNTAPTVTITGPETGHVQAVDTNVTLTATISDPDDGDTHTATWTIHDDNWGDQVIPGTVSGSTVQNVIQLASAGIYHISLTVSDAAGLSATAAIVNNDPAMPAFVVIYDPTGGFVTGGGWIISPAGALQWTPQGAPVQTEAKATFGFNSKYQKGASIPTGNTEFQFKAGDFRFKSTAYEWLVVAGSKAMYKGTGQIQDRPGTYTFILTGVDSSAGDRFRIKIWDEETGHAVYDNKRGQDDGADPTLIGGGSIQIHN